MQLYERLVTAQDAVYLGCAQASDLLRDVLAPYGGGDHPRPEEIEPPALRELYLASSAPLPWWSPVVNLRTTRSALAQLFPDGVREKYPTAAWEAECAAWEAVAVRLERALAALGHTPGQEDEEEETR